MQSNLLIPVGRGKGQPIATCALENLDWAINFIAGKLQAEPSSQYAGDNRRWLDEAQRVFAERSEGVVVEGPTTGTAPAPAARAAAPQPLVSPSQALARVPVGVIRDAASVSQTLIQAAQLGHLVSPAPAAGNLPEGCSILVSAIMIDQKRETYPVGGDDDDRGTGERGLSKVALDKLAGALAVDWDDQRSRRLDDGSHPHYCRYKAVGRVRNFDGSWRTIQGEKELDLRKGSAVVEVIETQAVRKQRRDGGANQIAQKRQHIQSLCETEARLRAIRTLGLRTAYNAEELAKPFIVAQLVFDGRSEDPEARAYFRERIADSFMGATKSLYGGAAPAPQLVESKGEPPPPLSAYGDAEDDDGPPNYGFADQPKRTGTGGPY
jgi:hypothetical protein